MRKLLMWLAAMLTSVSLVALNSESMAQSGDASSPKSGTRLITLGRGVAPALPSAALNHRTCSL
jgi:hypothetical protein